MPPASSVWEKVTLFIFKSVFLTALLVIAHFDKNPSYTSWYIYVCVLAMAAGGIAAGHRQDPTKYRGNSDAMVGRVLNGTKG
jgi:general stress protein CsbA